MSRENELWKTGDGGTYIETIAPAGYDILINGSNKYLNFNTVVGSSGYGFRDNAGTMEFKDSGGTWTTFASGVGTGTVTSVTGTTNRIVITGTPTVAPVIDISSSYVGQSSITTVGTLVAGAVPASLVTAGTFGTGAYVMDTSLRVPLIVGSTSTTGDLTLQTTSGVGATGADMHFLVGNNGATEAMTILNSGNVGIGTTGPLATLDVSGVSAAGLGVVGAPSFAIRTDLDTGMWSSGANTLNFSTGGTEAMRINSSGYLGIGTTNPLLPLVVTSSGNTSLEVSVGSGIVAQSFNRNTSAYSTLSLDGSAINLRPSGTTALSVIAGGNVGIGTIAPLTKLSVSSATDSPDTIPSLGAAGGRFSILNANAYGLVAGVLSNGNVFQQAQRVDGTATAYNLLLQPNGGRVGIGETNPGAKLHITDTAPGINLTEAGVRTYSVRAGGSSSGNFDIADLTAGATRFGITSTGNVNIGSITPAAKLSIAGSTNNIHLGEWVGSTAYNALYLNSNPVTSGAYTLLANDSGSVFLNANGAGDINFREDNNNLMTLTNGGNLGIGTTAPAQKLHVVGDGTYSATFMSGSVGIGATSPLSPLEIRTTGAGIQNLVGITNLQAAAANVGGELSFYGVGAATMGTIGSAWEAAATTESYLAFSTRLASVIGEKVRIDGSGNVGIGTTAPTAVLHLKAGTATANTAPLKFTTGTLNTTAEIGAYEYNNDHHLTNWKLVRYSVGGTIHESFADATVGGAEADIYTFTTIANTLGTNGDKLIASYSGNFVTVGTELTQLKAYFAGTAIWDSTGIAVATGTSSWKVTIEIIRVSSTVVRYSVALNTTGASGFVYETTGELTGLTLSNTNIIKLTGTSSGVGSGSGDIIGKMYYLKFEPAT